jgi:peptide/nickel transport system ATP-binding protein
MRPVEEEARGYVLDLLRLVRIPEATKVYGEYPHELSGGMQQRVMIAMALAGEPALMIADEPTTALDVTTQAQILWLLKDLRKRINAAILYITHDLAVIAELSDRVAVMYAGKIVEDSPVSDLFREPLHPYTQGLLESIVSTESRQLEPGSPLPTIPGVVPDLLNPPSGCRFHPRCKFAFERCRLEEPLLLSPSPNRKVACHLYDKEAANVRAP